MTEDSDASFDSLVKDFLKGSGVPCPELFDEAKIHFEPVLALGTTDLDSDGFRSRTFCWAATGSCDRETNSSQITVGVLYFLKRITIQL
jgi:hypothetical protein